MKKQISKMILAHIFALFVLPFTLTSCMENTQRLKGRPTVANFDQELDEDDIQPSPEPTGSAESGERVSGQVFISPDYCVCLEKKPDSLNSCDSFCSTKADKNPTLYVNTTVGPEIELNPDLGDLFNWCKRDVGDGRINPNCQLEAWDGVDKILMDVTLTAGSNSFKADVTQLERDKVYVMTLVEDGSGSGARSKTFHLSRKLYEEDTDSNLGILKITPVQQYYCINRMGYTEETPTGTTNEHFTKAIRRHFYFTRTNEPPALPPGDTSTFCHDVTKYGTEDGPLFPRLGLKENVFYIWNSSDLRFYDRNANSALDVNDLISKRLAKEYKVTETAEWFFDFKYFSYPTTSAGDTLPTLGFLLRPFNDEQSLTAYCPNQKNYANGQGLLRISRDIVGVDTEGLYFAQKQPETYEDSTGAVKPAPLDYVLIRESLLKKIWFYLDKGRHIRPTDQTNSDRTIVFYWPADVNYPYIKKSTQQIFIVKHPSQLKDMATQTGLRTNVVPSDRRFACIPSSGN